MAKENIEQRVAELEIRISFQDQTIHELNEVVVRQQREFEHVTRELGRLKSLFVSMTPSAVAATADEAPPPHY